MGIKSGIPDKLVSRVVALEIIYLINQGNSLKQVFEHQRFVSLTSEAKGFVKFLVTQTIRYRNVFKKNIQRYLEKKPQNKSLEFIDAVLSLGACELLLSEQKPNITFSSYTDITKFDKKTVHLSGIIRAILGKIHSDIDILKPLFTDYQLVFGEDLYHHIQTDYSDSAYKIFEWLLAEPVVDATKLSHCPTPSSYLELSPDNMRFQQGIRPENSALFQDGEITIQSYASHLPIFCMTDIAGKTLLDLCAAPGGKTLQAVSKGAMVTAVDISEKRLEKLQENLQRTGLSAEILASDALKYQSNNLFDIVLLDAPCSATGTIRKNPDIIHNFDSQNIRDLKILQRNLLKQAVNLLKPKGILIYAVCSLSKAEGENQILEFLQEHNNLTIIKPYNTDLLPKDALDMHQFIRLLPYYDNNKGGHDGFFVAYLKKT